MLTDTEQRSFNWPFLNLWMWYMERAEWTLKILPGVGSSLVGCWH